MAYSELSEEQGSIYAMAAEFAAQELAPHALEWDQNRHFPVDVLRQAATLGMGGIYIRDDVGGSGLTRMDAALIFEALSQGCPVIASFLSIHNMCAWIIDRYGSDVQRNHWLPQLTAMDLIASYCLTEPSCGSDAANLTTKAVREGDEYRISGQKQFISGAGSSDVYIVMARTGAAGARGISAFIIPKDAEGLSFGANEKKMGWNAQPTRTVMLDNVRVPVANLIGEEGLGFKIAMSALDGGRLNIAACSLGGAQAAFDKAAGYCAGRKAFGVPLHDFQALQFRLADMATELEVARTFLYRAARALDRHDHDALKLCAMAKRYVTDAGFNVTNQALQLHGGYGYLSEYGVEKLLRDLRVHQILEGTNEIMRVIIARELMK